MAAHGYCLREYVLLLIRTVLVLAGTPVVSAHAPLGTGFNEDIANATFFDSPEKSFVLYTELHESGEARVLSLPYTVTRR